MAKSKRDNIHYSFRKVDGYKKPNVFVISAREAGKSTAVWLDKSYKKFKDKGQTTLVIRRNIVSITNAYIDSIFKIIRKFNPDDELEVHYQRGALKEGIVDVKVNGVTYLLIVALSVSIDRIKSLVLENIGVIIFDEFIVNKAFGEKYLSKEIDRFKEVYNTFYRESEETLVTYFLGNPYSLYNPYFLHYGVDITKLKPGIILSGDTWVVECYELTQELKDYILSRNPLYQFDDSYTRYAFNGEAVNDMNVRLLTTPPPQFGLQFVVRMEGKLIGFFFNKNVKSEKDDYFHCRFMDSTKREVICFDFGELVDGAVLWNTRSDRWIFEMFKIAMRTRRVTFGDINVYNLCEQIYYQL